MFDWHQYREYAVIKTCKKNASLFRQGERVNGFYYLHQGKLAISVLREDGHERMIDFVYPGSLSGEQMINSSASFTNATVLADATLYFFSREQFALLSKDHPRASHKFGLSLISKVRLLANIHTILTASVDVQLAHFLVNVSEKENTKRIAINQTLLAKYIGKSRVSIWKVLKEWRQAGVIEIDRQTILLKKPDRLKALIQF